MTVDHDYNHLQTNNCNCDHDNNYDKPLHLYINNDKNNANDYYIINNNYYYDWYIDDNHDNLLQYTLNIDVGGNNDN